MTVAIARGAIGEGGDLALAAASALRGLLDSPHGPTGTDALDVLVGTALDPSAERRVRLAAFDALQGMPEGVRARVAEALQADPDPGLKARVGDLPRDAAAADAVWQDALEGRLPDTLRRAARRRADACSRRGPECATANDPCRASPRRCGRNAEKQMEWRTVRGTLHQALALRGSRVAVDPFP